MSNSRKSSDLRFKSILSSLVSHLSSSIFKIGARGFVLTLWAIAFALFLISCTREKREFRQAPPGARTEAISQSDLRPGGYIPAVQTKNPAEENAAALGEGKRLFEWYNCSGCHFHGGGGIGPALMDSKWIYGSDPANIYETIVQGRPNGMPSFRDKIPDYQVWEIVAYVRSLSGQVRRDAAPARDDHMRATEAPAETTPEHPKGTGVPKSAERPQ